MVPCNFLKSIADAENRNLKNGRFSVFRIHQKDLLRIIEGEQKRTSRLNIAGSTCGASLSYTEYGDPERITPFGFHGKSDIFWVHGSISA
jgi:hypothetical protein